MKPRERRHQEWLRQGVTPPKPISMQQLGTLLKNQSEEATQAFQRGFARAQARLKADAEFQRRSNMSQDERGAEATEWLAKELMDWERKRGNYISFEQAKKRIADIAHKHELKVK